MIRKHILAGIIAGGGGGITFARSASAANFGFTMSDNVTSAGDPTLGRNRVYFRFPLIFCTKQALRFRVVLANLGAFATYTNTLQLECAIEDGATNIPVTWGGATSYTAAISEVKESDSIPASAFPTPPVNRQCWIRGVFTLPNVSGSRQPRQGTSVSSHIAGTQSYACNSAANPGSVYATGPFTVGVGMYALPRTLAPIVIGDFVDDPAPYLAQGDSLFAGNANSTGDSMGGWVMKAMRDASLLNPRPIINFGEPGRKADDTIIANVRWAYPYCKNMVEGFGTNAGINAGNASYSLQTSLNLAIDAKANGISKVLRVALIPKTTGTFTSDAGQSPYDSGWVVGGVIDIWNRTDLPAKTAPSANYVWDALVPFVSVRSPSDYWKWINTGGVAYTADGIHPLVNGEILMADEARPTIQALP